MALSSNNLYNKTYFTINHYDGDTYVTKFGSPNHWDEILNGFKGCLTSSKGRYQPHMKAWTAKKDELEKIRVWLNTKPFWEYVEWLGNDITNTITNINTDGNNTQYQKKQNPSNPNPSSNTSSKTNTSTSTKTQTNVNASAFYDVFTSAQPQPNPQSQSTYKSKAKPTSKAKPNPTINPNPSTDFAVIDETPLDKAYQLLHLRQGVTLDVLTSTWKALMKIYHTDKNPYVEKGFDTQLNVAYQLIKANIKS